MHIRHIPPYALAAGALVVSVLLFGDDKGADAATGAVTGTVAESAGTAGTAEADATAGAAGAGTSDTASAVVVRPEPVAPGAAFSVSDGGRCSGDTAEAVFDDAGLPAVRLSAQSGGLGGTATVPEGTAPGSYRVTLTCGGASGARQSALDTGRPGGDEDSDAADGSEDRGGRGVAYGQESADGTRTLTGTMVVSDGADGVVPQGGADTGLGGAAGTGRAATTAGGVLLLAAAGWGALARRRSRAARS
ncbi:hypothetical protein AB0G60_29730 [Streptomyces angustmyceticus]|uniref:Uncharacterized protein n=1 Tax=Streptomyces angustmyceticus TaxID=285578 RepID=A0A5J4LP05_9ACTN|nr:hypothetical protein [Streptomyces angustmyceticus]UAL70105.1 hypothetical protein K7396_29040 [Streptomyces angustmyceticus]GES33761.1 hypothetical protein San01_62490 [Streptomyces angustmyceticus]